jgi:hypothetical protein
MGTDGTFTGFFGSVCVEKLGYVPSVPSFAVPSFAHFSADRLTPKRRSNFKLCGAPSFAVFERACPERS